MVCNYFSRMRTLQVLAVVVLALLLVVPGRIYADEGKEGNIHVIKVKGAPTLVDEGDKSTTELKEGVYVKQGHVIKTGKGEQAVLLFSNGTVITIEPNSTFSIDKFLQVPFDSTKVDYAKAKNEPSISQTKVTVSEGSIVGDVAKLNKGSTFNIGTPVGVAGIRGTTIRITVTKTSTGATVSVQLPEGVADFSSLNGQTVTLTDGKQVTFSLNTTTGNLDVSSVSPITQAEAAEIAQLVEQSQRDIPDSPFSSLDPNTNPEVQSETNGFDLGPGTFDNGAPNGGGNGGGGGGGGGGGNTNPNPPAS